MRRSTRIGDRDPCGEARPSAEGMKTAAEQLLAAMQMRATGKIDPDPVVRRRRCDRRPASYGEQGQAIEQRAIRLRISRADVEVRYERACVGRRHARIHALGARPIARGDDVFSPPDLAYQRQRRVPQQWEGMGRCRSSLHHGLKRMAGRLRPATEFAYGGTRMRWKRCDLCLNNSPRRQPLPRPPGARTPSAAPGHRTVPRIVVDRHLEDRPFRLLQSGPFQPPQPIDG